MTEFKAIRYKRGFYELLLDSTERRHNIYFGLSSTSIPQPGHGYIDGFLAYSVMYNYELKRAWVSDKS